MMLIITVPTHSSGTGMFFAADIAHILNAVLCAQRQTAQTLTALNTFGLAVNRVQEDTIAAVAIACGLEVNYE